MQNNLYVMCLQVHDESVRGMVEKAVGEMYAQLETQIGDQGECDALRIMLEDSPCVWAGAGFVRADHAVKHLDQDYRPYLHKIPDVVAQNSQLMRLLGVCTPPLLFMSFRTSVKAFAYVIRIVCGPRSCSIDCVVEKSWFVLSNVNVTIRLVLKLQQI